MQILRIVLQVIVALSLLNVWLLRFRRSTAYRGGNAQSMREEFAFYGLPGWFIYVMGTLKIGASVCLFAGIWFRGLVWPAAFLVCILMCGALAMHMKVRDPWMKSLPAVIVLALSVTICLIGPSLFSRLV